VIADIDGFKAINDARGHQAGDRALRETAAALGTALRRGDELFASAATSSRRSSGSPTGTRRSSSGGACGPP
jgi:GGDEF domain-containing protein